MEAPKSDLRAKPPWPSTTVRHPRLKLSSRYYLESAPLARSCQFLPSKVGGCPILPDAVCRGGWVCPC